jgi:acetolactate decarboxylase
MAKEVVDDRFIGALHLLALTRKGLRHDANTERTAIQAGTINSLLDGCYEGDITIAELLRLGTDGIGTVQNLDGELIVLHGVAYCARADGSVVVVESDTKTPFAVLTKFTPSACTLVDAMGFKDFLSYLDTVSPNAPVIAIRASGKFQNLHLRSIAKQYPPYRPLSEVVADQTEWRFDMADGDIIGFRFPDTLAGVEVPGWHLHFLTKDRTHGGHVISLDVLDAKVEVNSCDHLHVELPKNIGIGTIGSVDRKAIDAVEGR